MTNNNSDIFERACLVQLSSSIWNGTKAIEPAVMKEIAENGGDTEWLKGFKDLINREMLGPIRTAVSNARNTIRRFALPFPITSIYLVPKENLEIIDEQLQIFKEKFWEQFYEFEAIYGDALDEARVKLGELYNEADYPTDIRSKFNFEWRYVALTVPGRNTVLSPEIYQREKEKFQGMMEETRELAMVALREEFSDVLKYITERLNTNGNGKTKVLQTSMFNKLQEFLDEFGNRNIFIDEKLAELTSQARNAITGVTAYNLKFNTKIRDEITVSMNELKTTIDAAIIDMPRRQIELN